MSQYCKDCKHVRRGLVFGMLDATCEASRKRGHDYVRGVPYQGPKCFCESHRQGAHCGDFEQKPPSVLQRIKARLVT